MAPIEVTLLIIGFILISTSYIISEKISNQRNNKSGLIDLNMITEDKLKSKIDVIADGLVKDLVEQTEIELDKLTNLKMLAVSEYSDTVLNEINKNHNEVMFLYNMLNDKEMEIKDTVREVVSMKKHVNSSDENTNIQNLQVSAKLYENHTEKTLTKDTKIAEHIEESEQQDLIINNEIILQLYKEGKTLIEIAKELGLGLGEVRLVIDLYRSR